MNNVTESRGTYPCCSGVGTILMSWGRAFWMLILRIVKKTIHYSFLDIQHTIRFRDIQQAATTDSDSFRATL